MNIATAYAGLIQAIGDGTGMTDTLLHLHAGLAIMFATRVVTKRPLSSPWPLLVVAIAEGANEVLDRLHYHSWRWADTSSDIANTLFWPTMLFIGLRWRRARR